MLDNIHKEMNTLDRKFYYAPDALFYSIQELEKRLDFLFLPTIGFESERDKLDIQKKGFQLLKSPGVRQRSQELGIKYKAFMEQSYIPDVSIRWINPHIGHGLFAEENIACESYVGEYAGLIRQNTSKYPLNPYAYEYPLLATKGYIIDATQGHLTRFINHSASPNLDPVYAFENGFYHLIFLAKIPIPKGTQLSYHYGHAYWMARTAPLALN